MSESQAIKISDDDNGLNLPAKVDEHDEYLDKQILAQANEAQKVASSDTELIQTFQHQLEQANRSVKLGEMGRALALSKLESIKESVKTLDQNIK